MSYSPQIKGDLIRRLYQLKQKEKRPMTRLVNEAVTEYLEKKEKEDGKERFISTIAELIEKIYVKSLKVRNERMDRLSFYCS